MIDELHKVKYLTEEGYNIRFGLGCIQWTTRDRNYALVTAYKDMNKGAKTITEQQVLQAECDLLIYEWKKSYSEHYTKWRADNKADLNSKTAAGKAGEIVCVKYEGPSDEASYIRRGKLAQDIYSEIK